MGDVIHVAFGRQAPGPERLRRFLLSDIDYLRTNRTRVAHAGTIAQTMTRFIFGPENRSGMRAALGTRQDALKNLSLEILCTFFIDSKELDWKIQPSYYRAALIEFSDRCDMLARLEAELAKREHPRET